ncbi:MAG: hypothetical protein ABI432_06240 [Flavobacteriales bacterium]
MLRNILFALLALALFIVCVMLGDGASASLFPPTPGLDFTNADALRAYMESVPTSCFVVMLLGHALGSVLAGFIVARFTRDKEGRPGSVATAFIVCALITFAGVMNLVRIPHPTWFWSDVLTYPIFMLIGYLAGRRKQ